jgi:GNAT superfamily N-acetyltransferase
MTAAHAVSPQHWNRSEIDSLFDSRVPKLLEVEAALRGQTKAQLYVDRLAAPRTAALNVGVSWHLAGDPDPHFLRAINRLLPRDTYSVLILPEIGPQEWLRPLSEDLYFVRARSRYAERTEAAARAVPCPQGYRLRPVDGTLLGGGAAGVEELGECILDTWDSLEDFETKGFGFVVLHESRIVGHSITDYVCGDRCEIGVRIDEEHRLRGLGTLVATSTANEAFARGIHRVGWMSWAGNLGSVAVSRRAGFAEACKYDVYINHWPAENPEDLSQEEFRTFAGEYEQRFAEQPPLQSGYPHVVAATAWALAGSGEKCRGQLLCAIDMGWLRSVDQLRRLWPELFEVEGLAERKPWSELFARLE